MLVASRAAVYNADNHPSVKKGEKSADEILTQLLKNFEGGAAKADKDGNVTQQEFEGTRAFVAKIKV